VRWDPSGAWAGTAPIGGGRRLVWLVEPREGHGGFAALGEVRLTFGGVQYNAVTNATSTKPFAPDMIIHDYAKFVLAHPAWLGPRKLFPERVQP
jgi:hypothetical protein